MVCILQVGGWIEQAKALAKQQPGTDCVAKGFPEIKDCEHFYEWNARVQITTCALHCRSCLSCC